MTVPTITSVSPTAGTSKGGALIHILGTGFRVPPAPPPPAYTGTAAQRTVAVTIGGTPCIRADAWTAERIAALPAPWTGDYDTLPAWCAVRVANLDDAGSEIPGEAATLSDAYCIDRPPLAGGTRLDRVLRALIGGLRRHVLRNTHLTMATAYDADLGLPPRVVAALPALLLLDLRLRPNRLAAARTAPPTPDPADPPWGWRRSALPARWDLECTLQALGRGIPETTALLQAVILHIRDVPVLVVDDQEYAVVIPATAEAALQCAPTEADAGSARLPLLIMDVQLTEESATMQVLEAGRAVYAHDGVAQLDLARLEEAS
jgi:hypothetical protein